VQRLAGQVLSTRLKDIQDNLFDMFVFWHHTLCCESEPAIDDRDSNTLRFFGSCLELRCDGPSEFEYILEKVRVDGRLEP